MTEELPTRRWSEWLARHAVTARGCSRVAAEPWDRDLRVTHQRERRADPQCLSARCFRSLSGMRHASSSSIAPKCARHLLRAILMTIAVALCSGCFVIRHEQFSEPVGPVGSVRFHRIAAGCETYSRLVNTQEVRAVISVANWPSGWELQFLLNIIPIYRYDYGKTEALSVELWVEPKNSGLALDPEHVFFLDGDQRRLAPTNAWLLGSRDAKVSGRVPITNREAFHLEFPVEHRAYPQQDAPFQLSIEGLSVGGRSIPLAPITFQSKTTTKPGFRLPY
ncbi:MAG TPA: hypothetical protein VG146_13980 [Verrucomicrobiae bacterium]|nr:hypothetical protein [Verrucomicrobiae bacterium]